MHIHADVALLYDFRHFQIFRNSVIRIQENGEMNTPRISRLKNQALDPSTLRLWALVYGKVIAWSSGSAPHCLSEARIETNSCFLPPSYGSREKFQYLCRSE